MHAIDWLVLLVALASMVAYGIWKGGRSTTMEGYLLAGRSMPWYMVGLSAMATQASAITFLSTTGQGYEGGLRFVQFYFGLPLATVVLCVTLVPLFQRLRVYTAYEFLERRFDLKTRTLASGLFLVQRGVSTGISLYAPALVLADLLEINILITNTLIGALVIIYTLTGGAKAVGFTQMHQMVVIWTGMLLALGILIYLLPPEVNFFSAVRLAARLNHLKAITTHFDWNDRYTLYSGLLGGFFLQLSYFGTDQSQVQRYLTARSLTESRLGLLLNGLIKVPMQALILFIGAMVFIFYQFTPPPLSFNPTIRSQVVASAQGPAFQGLEKEYAAHFEGKRRAVITLNAALGTSKQAQAQAANLQLASHQQIMDSLRLKAGALVTQATGQPAPPDADHVFLTFVKNYLPIGVVGLLVAVIFAASMSSIAGAFSALSSSTTMDVYRRLIHPGATEKQTLRFSRLSTLGWGVFSIVMAAYASRLGNLIEAVNILGSLFYGAILGIFVVAFYFKWLGGTATFMAALVAEALVLLCWNFTSLSYLWYNAIGCLLVPLLAWPLQALLPKRPALQLGD